MYKLSTNNVRRAFTLIELLVVIAIIAILAAILFPVFAQAREKARQAACLSNTKQMSLGIMQYAQDYDELLPVVGDNGANRGRWFHQIYPYVKSAEVFTCPNLPEAKLVNPATFIPNSASANSGYGWNGSLSYAGTGTTDQPGFSLADIRKPSETIVVGDTGMDIGNSTGYQGYLMFPRDPRIGPEGTGAFAGGTRTNAPYFYAQFRHNTTKTAPVTTASGAVATLPTEGRANFSFLDGHSKSLDVGTAFALAPTGPSGFPEEDGQPLRTPKGASSVTGSVPFGEVPYVLWNNY